MPVMDGLEATRDVRLSGREDGGSVPIITMTGNVSDGESRQAIRSGMNGRLSISHEGCPGPSCPALSCRFFRLIFSLAGYRSRRMFALFMFHGSCPLCLRIAQDDWRGLFFKVFLVFRFFPSFLSF